MASGDDLETRLRELRSKGAGILSCIRYVMVNQNRSLLEATAVVVNSTAWADKKEEFIRQQQEAFEEFLDYKKDRIAAIHMTLTPDRTEVVAEIAPPDKPREGASESPTSSDGGA